MNGMVLGLLDGEELGVNVKNIKFVVISEYLYLIAFCDELLKFEVIGSQ